MRQPPEPIACPISRPSRSVGSLLFLAAVGVVATACATPGAVPPASGVSETPESVWDGLYRPRPDPLPGASAITVSEILILGDPWKLEAPVTPGLGIQELVSAQLLQRRDVHFVERRRFTLAAERERRGEADPPGAPPVGVSPGADLTLSGSWAPAGPDSAALDFRLIRTESGEVVETFRQMMSLEADPVSVSRAVTASLLDTLRELERLPEWTDPIPRTATAEYAPSGIGDEAVAAFFRGVAHEDRYDWEGARRAYQEALDLGGDGFFEAEVALARVARLRRGGSLGVGDRP